MKPLLALLTFCAVAATAQSQSHIVRPMALHQTRYRLRAGESTAIVAPRETLDFVRDAKSRTARIVGNDHARFVVGTRRRSNDVVLAASLTAQPGEYQVEISALNAAGEGRYATVDVVLDPPETVPSTATKPPVVLLDGWSINFSNSNGYCSTDTLDPTAGTFGYLPTVLQGDGVPVVYLFDNCVECPDCYIEDIGNVLPQVLSQIRYDNGSLVPQVDLVGESGPQSQDHFSAAIS
jgi:hypothetical protein